jgi:glycolate oxidase FAD binding subunit
LTLESKDIEAIVRAAAAEAAPLRIRGGDTKAFYGRQTNGQLLDVSGHAGIISYEPTELVITARAGTRLKDIEAALAESDQMLSFEPPHFGDGATLGGAVASGLSGPARPYTGALRDFLLGVVCINGAGERLSFGGQVMKNVAGYDISRLMAGAMGTLGVMLELSLKVLPKPTCELTLAFAVDAATAIATTAKWAAQPLPFSAACHDGEILRVRLSGSESGVNAAHQKIGGEEVADGDSYWQALREHRLPYFSNTQPLWRLSVPATTPATSINGQWILDWGGAQRWCVSDIPADLIRQQASSVGGHAILFRGGDRTSEVFHPLPAPLVTLHRRLKDAFDPKKILNPGRLYRDL